MRNKIVYTIAVLLGLSCAGCNDWLERDPSDILTDDQVWNDVTMIDGVLANYYSRMPENASLSNESIQRNKSENFSVIGSRNWMPFGFHAVFDDAMWSGNANYTEQYRNNFTAYPYDWFRLWDYDLIRDLNLAIEKCETATLSEEERALYQAEFRFMRAQVYFDLVKRMGGVPLVTEVYTYEPGMDITRLQLPRSKEYEVYDFIAREVDEIKEALVANGSSQTRANKYAALALKSRAMLYAGSIARYNSRMANPITMTGEYVGIPASMAEEYYRKALDASQQIINDGVFSLKMDATNADNFYSAVCEKSNNTEVIWARDYSSTYFHLFTFDNIPRSIREDASSATIVPTLNLVESYDYLDGSPGRIKDKDADGNYICYESLWEVFDQKDARMLGTVLTPGSSFRGRELSFQAGVAVYNEDGSYTFSHIPSVDDLGARYTDGGLWTGGDGPMAEATVSSTGFSLRKFVDTRSGSSNRGQGSEMWWVWYRMGEIYLNAAEAAFELGQTSTALTYINKVRERAGFGANSLSDLTIEIFQKERRNELAFEDHRLWDAKRWRIAHQLWDGYATTESANCYALWPYRIVGGPDNNKYLFDRKVAPRFEQPRSFRRGNYYSSIEQEVLKRNFKLIQNPNL